MVVTMVVVTIVIVVIVVVIVVIVLWLRGYREVDVFISILSFYLYIS